MLRGRRPHITLSVVNPFAISANRLFDNAKTRRRRVIPAPAGDESRVAIQSSYYYTVS